LWGFYIDFNYYFFREIEAFSWIAMLFKYIFSGIEAFLKPNAAEVFCPNPSWQPYVAFSRVSLNGLRLDEWKTHK
jgi:hypothetical protein